MTTPVVTELPRQLEPTTADDFGQTCSSRCCARSGTPKFALSPTVAANRAPGGWPSDR